MDAVLANGSIIHTSAQEDPELFYVSGLDNSVDSNLLSAGSPGRC